MATAAHYTAMLSPMVEAGIIRLDEVGAATAVLQKQAAGEDVSAEETAVAAKVEAGKKATKSLLPLTAVAAIVARAFMF